MKYEIISKTTGQVFTQYGKSIADVRYKIGHANVVIKPMLRKGNQFDIGGKQYWTKRKAGCIVDSRPSIMAEKLGI